MRYITVSRSLTMFIILILALAFSLTACGNASRPNSNSNGIGTGASSTTNTPQPHATAAQGTVTPGQVKLVVAKPHYASNEEITVTIINGLSNSIYASAYYTNCTPIALEWKTTSGWVPQGRCHSAQSTHVIELKPGSTTLLQLTPTSGSLKPTTNTVWQPGTYRASFYYSMAPDPDNTQGTNIQTADFTIG